MNKFNKVRKLLVSSLVLFGIGIIICVIIVSNRGLIGWQNLITKTLWFYLFAVITYIIFFILVPMLHRYFKKKSNKK